MKKLNAFIARLVYRGMPKHLEDAINRKGEMGGELMQASIDVYSSTLEELEKPKNEKTKLSTKEAEERRRVLEEEEKELDLLIQRTIGDISDVNVLEEIIFDSSIPTSVIRIALSNPHVPKRIFIELAKEEENRFMLAAHPSTPQEVLEAIFDEPIIRIKFSYSIALASNPSTEPNLLHEITLFILDAIDMYAGRNYNTGERTTRDFEYKDRPYSEVVNKLIENKKTPYISLDALMSAQMLPEEDLAKIKKHPNYNEK